MKLSASVFTVVIALLLETGMISAGPIAVRDNNIGDIVTVGVNVKADIKTDIDTSIVNVLVALLTQVGNIELQQGPGQQVPEAPITMQKADLMKTIDSLKGLARLSEQPKEETEQIFNQHAKEFIQALLKKN